MKVVGVVFAALVASCSAFAPPVPAIGVARPSTALRAYVPDGVSAADWAKMQAEAAKKKVDNKKKFTGKKSNDLGEWLRAREKKSPGVPFAGMTFAKVKGPADKVGPRAAAFIDKLKATK